jgi:hypothetical protein
MRVVEAEETDLGCTLVLEWGRRQDFPRARGTRTHPMGKQRAGAPASSVAGERLWPRRASATMGRGSSPQRARGNIALPRDRRQAHDNDGEHSGEATASGVPLPGVPSPLCRCPPPPHDPEAGGCREGGRTWSHLSASPWFCQQNAVGAEPRGCRRCPYSFFRGRDIYPT